MADPDGNANTVQTALAELSDDDLWDRGLGSAACVMPGGLFHEVSAG